MTKYCLLLVLFLTACDFNVHREVYDAAVEKCQNHNGLDWVAMDSLMTSVQDRRAIARCKNGDKINFQLMIKR